jgi:glycosyltransferase 2 family protein
MNKTNIRGFLVGIAIGAVCLVLVFKKVGVAQPWRLLSHINGNWVCLALAISASNLLLRAWRWQGMFPPRSRPTLKGCVQVLAIGNLANNLLPGRLGDLARCTLIGRKFSASDTGEAVATLGMEKISDGCALVALLLVSITIFSPPRWVWQLGAVSGLTFTAALIFLLALRLWAEPVKAKVLWVVCLLRIPRLTNRVSELLSSFTSALREIKSSEQLIVIFLITIVIWMTEAALIWAMAASVNVSVAGSSAMFVAAVIGLGFVIPAAPAALGTYEAFGVAAFQSVGVSPSEGLAITLLLHGWVFLTTSSFGLLSLAFAGRRFSGFFSRAQTTISSQLEPEAKPAPGDCL